MADPTIRWDGHSVLFGIDSEQDPSVLRVTQAAKAVNRIFRGGKNLTRPAIKGRQLHFSNDEDKAQINEGNFQGAMFYRKCRPGRVDGIIAAFAGSLFFLQICSTYALVTRVFDGLSAKAMSVYFCQAEEWIYAQDGLNYPVFWDGLLPSSARQSLGPAAQEMPIGTLMVYSHGRICVTNQFNQISFSDIIFGSGFTTSTNVQKFTENTYWQEGGYFTTPSNLGDITGLAVVPKQSINVQGQGEVVFICRYGAFGMDISIPREQWKDTNMQATTMIGRGGVSPWSVIDVNGDLWFRSTDGWGSYANSRSDFNRHTAFRKFSREVSTYLDYDNKVYLQYASHTFFNSRILGTTRPIVRPCGNPDWGTHRYHAGIVVLDLDQSSGSLNVESLGNASGSEVNWDGLWTGIQPTQFVKGVIDNVERQFAFSFDRDDTNRLYEFLPNAGEDDAKEGEVAKQIESFYVTRKFDHSIAQDTNAFEVKELTGGELWLSGITRDISVSVSHRPNSTQGWLTWLRETPIVILTNPTLVDENLGYSQPTYERLIFPSPNQRERQIGKTLLATHASQQQIMVKLKGCVKVDRLRISVKQNETTDTQNTCGGFKLPPSQGEVENDFDYAIVTAP